MLYLKLSKSIKKARTKLKLSIKTKRQVSGRLKRSGVVGANQDRNVYDD